MCKIRRSRTTYCLRASVTQYSVRHFNVSHQRQLNFYPQVNNPEGKEELITQFVYNQFVY